MERDCRNCLYSHVNHYEMPCKDCDREKGWRPKEPEEKKMISCVKSEYCKHYKNINICQNCSMGYLNRYEPKDQPKQQETWYLRKIINQKETNCIITERISKENESEMSSYCYILSTKSIQVDKGTEVKEIWRLLNE